MNQLLKSLPFDLAFSHFSHSKKLTTPIKDLLFEATEKLLSPERKPAVLQVLRTLHNCVTNKENDVIDFCFELLECILEISSDEATEIVQELFEEDSILEWFFMNQNPTVTYCKNVKFFRVSYYSSYIALVDTNI